MPTLASWSLHWVNARVVPRSDAWPRTAHTAVAGHFGLGLSLGAAVLFGAVLAPTDPVLASDVQVTEPEGRDRLRFALTGEAGLNDGTAFPFLMLGLGLLDHHMLGDGWSRWWLVDVGWAIPGGLLINFGMGTAVGTLVPYPRRTSPDAVSRVNFLAMGLIALSYGIALLHTYSFLAVSAAGLAMRKIEERVVGPGTAPDAVLEEVAEEMEDRAATDDRVAPAHMTCSLLHFNE